MYNSIRLTLYTQNNCAYCDIMKNKLNKWGFNFHEINISNDMFAKSFMKEKQLKTVPQLFYHREHLNKNISTREFTEKMLHDNLDYENYIGGVEHWGQSAASQ